MRSARAPGFPRLYAAASLKHDDVRAHRPVRLRGFPRLYAAASLKQAGGGHRGIDAWRFSAALCRGLIEAAQLSIWEKASKTGFSAALCRGLIEAHALTGGTDSAILGFPRLYAAASLKQDRSEAHRSAIIAGFPRLYAAASLKLPVSEDRIQGVHRFSAALCRGLIEARATYFGSRWTGRVFRGFMPRPH